MTSTVIWQGFDRKLVESENKIELFKRTSGILTICAICFALAAFFFYTGGGFSPDSKKDGFDLLVQGSAGLFALIGCLTLIGTFAVAFSKNFRTWAILDKVSRTMKTGQDIISLDQIKTFEIKPFSSKFMGFGYTKPNGQWKLIMTASNRNLQLLEGIKARFNSYLNSDVTTLPEPPITAAGSMLAVQDKLRATIFLAIGLLWTIGGYFFFADLYFVSSRGDGGIPIPVWSVGIIAIILGLWTFRRVRSVSKM